MAALLNSGPESKAALMAASAFVMIPTTWLRDMSGLSKVGILGAIASVGMIGIIAYTFASGGGLAGASPDALSAGSLVHLSTLPLTFGLLAFVFAGHAVFPSIYRSMDEPKRFPELLDKTYSLVGLACVTVGVLSFFAVRRQRG